MINVILKDGETEKKFQIKKFSALQSFLFINKIISIIASTKISGNDESDKLKIITLIKRLSKVDNTDEENKSEEVKNIDVNELFPIFINVLKSAFSNTDEDKKNEIYNILLKQCYFINGVSVRQVSLAVEENDFIENPMTFFKLVIESAKYNYSFFLKEKI